MSLPTAQEVTNLFLYKDKVKPTNIVDTALIRPKSDYHTRKVDANEFMEGPGRFALASMSNLVKKFFTAADIPGYNYGQSLDLSKVEMADALGLEGKKSNIAFQQYNYDDGQGNYGERVYIWGSSSFKIGDDTRFVIDADGTRHIENLTIRPFDDDFDFTSKNRFTKWANSLLLKDKIDPSSIGRTVEFEFTGKENLPVQNAYYWEDYQAELSQEESSKVGSVFALPLPPLSLKEAIDELTDNLWNLGSTQFLDSENRPIIYGTNGDDDLSSESFLSDYDQFAPYSENGTVLIGGKGKDHMEGGSGNDIFYIQGSDDEYDTFKGGAGTDTIMGSSEADTIRLHNFTGANRVEIIDGNGGVDVIEGTGMSDRIDLSETTLTGIKEIRGGDRADTITLANGGTAVINDFVCGEYLKVIESIKFSDDLRSLLCFQV